MLKKIILFISILLLSPPIEASHLIGGDFTYIYLGNNKYQITLQVFRDCSDTYDFDNPASIAVYESNGNLIVNHLIPLAFRNKVGANPPDPCFIPPPGICIEKGIYIDTVLLPNSVFGYDMVYQRCCRNSSVLNIQNPSLTGTTITSHIPANNVASSNNSVQFVSLPPVFICVNTPFTYNFSATDSDGDSLVYNLCTPFDGGTFANSRPNPPTPPSYNNIVWTSGYTTTNPISSSSAINFNSQTGQISFTPNMIGQFAICVCVDEYRNGILLNTTRREIQLNSVPCGTVASIPSQTIFCDGQTVNFQNTSTNSNSFFWNFGDPNIITDTSNLNAPSYTYADTGTYQVMLIALNNTYGSCRDTAYTTFRVYPLLAPTIQPSTQCFDNNNFFFQVNGSYSSTANFNWNFGNHAIPNSSNVNNPNNVIFDTAGIHPISLIVSQYGCSDTLHTTVNLIKPITDFDISSQNCSGFTIHFANYSYNASTYLWDFGDSKILTDTSSLYNPTYIYPDTGLYQIRLIAFQNGCSDTSIQTLHVYDTLRLFSPNTIPTQCLNNNLFNFYANGLYNSSATFSWGFDSSATILTSSLENPQGIHFSKVGNHIIRLVVSQNGCSRQRADVVKVLPNPNASFSTNDTIGCEPLSTSFINTSIFPIPLHYNWLIDGVNDTTTHPNHIFYNQGTYSIQLVAIDTNGCSDTLKKNNYITVNPKPQAIALVNPVKTDIIQPNITFYDNTQGTHSTFFNLGDESFETLPIVQHSYKDTGKYNWFLIVTNSFGCKDTIDGVIEITETSQVYIPNSFTPNNDGLNDEFKPVISNYRSVTLQIYDRWGILIFNTNDIKKGWNGNFKNSDNRCQIDTYIYKLNVTFTDNSEKEYKGIVTLLK
ncbi:MAG: PKD domain-containing protein [Bacteroidota bacterium]